jgi:hypothetical protein
MAQSGIPGCAARTRLTAHAGVAWAPDEGAVGPACAAAGRAREAQR